MFLLDTNIISEIRKGDRCNERVANWYAGVKEADLFLSVLVTGEIRKGIELIRDRDLQQAEALESWLQKVLQSFSGRILPIDARVADTWGKMNAIRTIPVIDGLLVATAKVHDMTLVTRNSDDIKGLSASVLNPFSG